MKIAILFLSLVSSTAFAFPEVKLVNTQKYAVREVLGAYSPGKSYSPSLAPTVVIPYQRTFAQFGGISAGNKRIVCGPSPETNTLNCFDLKHGAFYAGSFPVPGMISTTPVFDDNAWLIGTAQGFLMRVSANPKNRNLPNLGYETSNLWGANARKYMYSFRPKPIYTDGQQVQPSENAQPKMPQGVKWILPTSSSFVGTPIIQNNIAYLFSANQYLQALDWSTGKSVWSLRLAPDSPLKLNSDALALTSSELVVGNSLGMLFVLNPTDGSTLWTTQIPAADSSQRTKTKLPAGPDKFPAIVAQPLIIGRNIIVSNAESMTQNISLDSHSVIWSYPVGSVTKPQLYNENTVILGTGNGRVVSINAQTGDVNWSTDVTSLSPITSLFITKSSVIFAATNSGQIYMLDPKKGQILASNFPIGQANGNFFSGYEDEDQDACLSFSTEGFRCFRAQL